MKAIQSYTLIAFIVLTAASCRSKQQAPATAIPAISDSIIKTVQTAPVVAENEQNELRLNGKVQPNESLQAKVYALVSGKIKNVQVELGDYVHKGQTLAIIQSTEVAGISNDVSTATENLAMTKKSLETAKELYDGKLATEQDYMAARIAYNKATADLNKARQIAAISGGKSSTYVVTAPLSGYIIEKNITNNSEVRSDNSNDLFAIADLSNVWILANVYEADINSIQLGDEVMVSTLANPSKEYPGKVDKIYSVLDPVSRTMKVRISMDNKNGELKPEMFATVKVKSKPSGNAMIAIPSKAVVLDNSKNYVVVKKGNRLECREVRLIRRIDPKSYVAGLMPGEEVVTDDQVFLYQALNNK